MQVGYIIVFLGWTIQASKYFVHEEETSFLRILCFFLVGFQLACIQCSSPIRRVSQIREHPCLDGTLTPVPCEQRINQSKLPFQNCVSALYRLALHGNGGNKKEIYSYKKLD
jgi:hypothetical protein